MLYRISLALLLLFSDALCSENYAAALRRPANNFRAKKANLKHASSNQVISKQTRYSPTKTKTQKKFTYNLCTKVQPHATPKAKTNTHSNGRNKPKRNYLRYFSVDFGYSIPAKQFPCNQCNLKEPADSYDYRKKFKKALLKSATIGLKLQEKFKIDLSFAYRGKYKYSYFIQKYNNDKEQKLYSYSMLLNGYFIPCKFKYIEPYITAGAGIAFNNAGDFYSARVSTLRGGEVHRNKQLGKMQKDFAWTIGLGTTLAISKHIKLNCAYKYTNLGKFFTSDSALKVPYGDYTRNIGVGGILKLHEAVLGTIFEF